MKNFIEKHPFWFALGFTIIVLQMLGLVVVVVGARMLGFPELPVRVFAALVTTIVPLYFIWRIGWWEDAGFVSTTQNAYALAVPLIFMFFALVLFGTVDIEAQRVNVLLAAVLLTGLSEEAIFRGLFVRAFLPSGKWQALLIPSVLFAAAHFVQSLGGLMTLEDNLLQIFEALISGLLFGAVRLRVNNIWPLVIIHALGDLFFATSGLLDGVYVMTDIPLAYFLIMWVTEIIAVVYLMRKPIAATVDGKPVDMMNKPLVAPAVDGQPAG
ncbi:MAG: CPBP family intramembrane metalloprotease [Anaerolineales bacterium]